MQTLTEPVEGNRVRLTVEVEESEIVKAVDATTRDMARQARIPGFRPGKVPRQVLEARMGGPGSLRREAIKELLPDLYARAVVDAELDPIAPPELDVTKGEDTGDLAFEAVVEVRPTVSIAGYSGLVVTVPSPEVTQEDIDAQIDRLRDQFAELATVSRPARDGDHVTVDISVHHHDVAIDSLCADDLVYEIGSAALVEALDAELRGSRVGDILQFNAAVDSSLLPDALRSSVAGELSGSGAGGSQGPGVPTGEGELEATFRVLVKEVREKVLPALDDSWVAESTELSTVEELRSDVEGRLKDLARFRSVLALRRGALEALAALVAEDVPESLVLQEMREQLHNLGHTLQDKGVTPEQYLQATGRDGQGFEAELRTAAIEAVKSDLALRALAANERIEAEEADIQAELDRLATRVKRSPAEVRAELEHADGLSGLRSEIRKSRALAWLIEHVEIVDEEGRTVPREAILGAEAEAGEASEASEGIEASEQDEKTGPGEASERGDAASGEGVVS
ncbi:MAG: trigger factor [Actinobacteria bacterium]|nr:trigger factor [Actinomycetota bacterium]